MLAMSTLMMPAAAAAAAMQAAGGVAAVAAQGPNTLQGLQNLPLQLQPKLDAPVKFATLATQIQSSTNKAGESPGRPVADAGPLLQC